ncbi:MAG: hypothetical protein II983_06415 [Firmicutes bacterium]|nr:hypothetical protein [Bacillota bacterium]MBQ6684786.1 hypothetical protein [Bacillota bacterium]
MAKCKELDEEMSYRIYVTDALKLIAENTAKMSSGSYMTKRYSDLFKKEKIDTRSGDEIAVDIIKKAGLVVI